MRTIHYTKEMIAASLAYPLRNPTKRILWSLLAFMFLMGLAFGPWLGPFAHAISVGLYAMGWAVLYLLRKRKAILVFDETRYGNTRSFEMMVDEDKIVIEEGEVKTTLMLEEIVEIAEFRGYVMAKNQTGISMTIPSGQLLDDEQMILDRVKSRLKEQAESAVA
jgi:hypothetical protein